MLFLVRIQVGKRVLVPQVRKFQFEKQIGQRIFVFFLNLLLFFFNFFLLSNFYFSLRVLHSYFTTLNLCLYFSSGPLNWVLNIRDGLV